MHITELVYLYGDQAIEMVYEEMDQRLQHFREWLDKQDDLSASLRQIHLANCHIMVELMAEHSPCIFPEEVVDYDDTAEEIADERSTTYGFKQFIYSTYIHMGPKPGKLMDRIMDSIKIYYDYLLDIGEIHIIPRVVQDTVQDREFFEERLAGFIDIDKKYAGDDQAWIKSFDEWALGF
ncbi:hypothetical protein ACFL54_06925 [Planctomycetota bacterium]